ncbi:MAG TPA: ABC transporter ATP-binding protein [Polyangiaceae bacterium]|nr:ABC transporter ATP-binding protein [Polyangiaceae bacterium]
MKPAVHSSRAVGNANTSVTSGHAAPDVSSRTSSGIRVKAAPPELEVRAMCKRFDSLIALDDVSLRLRPGSFHALLGENGAGKSTLVKCIMGFYRADSGSVLVDSQPIELKSPREAHRHGIGMVYQHFTLVENMTVAENLVLSRARVPAVIDFAKERAELESFMDTMPFRVPCEKRVRQLAAGEKQKLEILKQLYLGSRIVILDEPTSVLTPQEADEVLGLLRNMAHDGRISVAMITHKFREVMAFADEVTVLRRGRVVGGGSTNELTPETMAELMVGSKPPETRLERAPQAPGRTILELEGITAGDDIGVQVLNGVSLRVRAGEIVGIAGVSGNGQDELVEVLAGQRAASAGSVCVDGKPFRPTRAQLRARNVRLLPESPLRNACVANMSVAENIALRVFDTSPFTRLRAFVSRAAMRRNARARVNEYRIKTPSVDTPIGALSGGNVQRAVLARELAGTVALLIAANPCFGLDFAAVSEIRERIVTARNSGAAVLLVSADLEEVFALADRILVMSAGRIVFETEASLADPTEIGRHMAGHSGPSDRPESLPGT